MAFEMINNDNKQRIDGEEGVNMNKQLKYPIGCRISWCNEEYEVVENHSDQSGTVKQGNEIFTNFYFNYQGEEAVVIN